MALNGADLASAIVTALGIPTNPDLNTAEKAQILAYWTTICNADVAYRIANTEVIITNVTAVQPGTGSSGPGTGTIT